jgi:5-oxoprolinase (ATP-hydrolysing)
VTYSAIIYCLRCLVNEDIPLNQGCLAPIQVKIEENSLLSPSFDAAVVGGNVLTSQRLVDVILRAFGACAASQGDCNNFTFGVNAVAADGKSTSGWGYYETIAGGSGAGPTWSGKSGVHTHMTNTRITDPEVLEQRYPVILHEFSLRRGSGGRGKHHGGDGVIRELEFLEDGIQVSLLTERRVFQPYGLEGGEPGARGLNLWIRTKRGVTMNAGGKNTLVVEAGDRVRICTPGGGGWGRPV